MPTRGAAVSRPPGATHPFPAAGTRLLGGVDRPPLTSPPSGAPAAPQPAPTVARRYRSEESMPKIDALCRRRCRWLPVPRAPANVRERMVSDGRRGGVLGRVGGLGHPHLARFT